MLELIFIVIACIYLKWILFAFSCPLIYFYKKVETKSFQANINHKKELKSPSSDRLSARQKFVNFLAGYIRYMDLQVGKIPSHHLRTFIFKYVYRVNLGHNSVVYYGSEIRGHGLLKIGDRSIIGDNAILDARCGLCIGNDVQLGSNVKIWTEQHDYNDPYFRITDKHGPVKIGDKVWIGADVTILHSVKIGEGAVVASGAVVTHDVEPFSVVAGIPAKKVSERNHDLKYHFDGSYLSFY